MTKTILNISTDKEKLDLKLIFKFLKQSYWASGRTNEQIVKSIENSMCFGLYENDYQVGFARVITDQATFAYLADVFIVTSKRGLGYSKKLMHAILFDPNLNNGLTWYLMSKDAQGIYEKFGFTKYEEKEKTIMVKPAKMNYEEGQLS